MAIASAYGPSLRFTVKEPVCPDGPLHAAPSTKTRPSTAIQLRMTIPSTCGSWQAPLPEQPKEIALKLREVSGRLIEEPVTNACECWHFCARGRTLSGVLPRQRPPSLGANLASNVDAPPSLGRNTYASAMAQRPLVGETTSSTATTGGSLFRLHLAHRVG